MKCTHCGAWNQAYLPKCTACGHLLIGNNQHRRASWEDSMHAKKPGLTIVKYEDPREADADDLPASVEADAFDPEALDPSALTDELEELEDRREKGAERITAFKAHADQMRRSIQSAQIIVPLREAGDPLADPQVISRRQRRSEMRYASAIGVPSDDRSFDPSDDDERGFISDHPYAAPYVYVDDDEADNPDIPIYYDGYLPEENDPFASNGEGDLPRRIVPKQAQRNDYAAYNEKTIHRKRLARRMALLLCSLLLIAGLGVGSYLITAHFVISNDLQARDGLDVTYIVSESVSDGQPAHTLTFYGKENTTIYLPQTQSRYIIADGSIDIVIPDYMWYDTESSSYAVAATSDYVGVHITPTVRFTQEGKQYELDPIDYTVEAPLSPIRLNNPAVAYANVSVSVYEVSINVLPGSSVIIDGTNVSTLIREETGNVSKNVSVLPKGDNNIAISVKSKYCRENNMTITLHRAQQDIALELEATVLTEWNYLPDDPDHVASIKGTTLPGAAITVETDHSNLVVDPEKGEFSFTPRFTMIGSNDVVIRASYPGRTDAVITHTVTYIPNADIYTRRAWDLHSQYSDLVNYIAIRKGVIYTGTGTITSIISDSPQLALMNIGDENFEQLVMIENSSKTNWIVGERYRIYGEAYGTLYNGAPRLTVRYTYIPD